MSLTSLKHQYDQKISILMLMLLVMSLFQFCIAPINLAKDFLPVQAISKHNAASHLDDSTMDHSGHNHHCCLTEHSDSTPTPEFLKPSCPECDSEASAIQPLLPEFKSSFVLLYIVVEALVPTLFKHLHWQMLTEPRIHTSLPDLYLTKVSFLE